MERITQEAYYRQRVMKSVKKNGVTETSKRYHISRKTVHKWLKRYDGTVDSLKDRSRRPHHSPNQQKPWEEKLVKRYAKKHPGDMVLAYQEAQRRGYARSYGCFKRTARRLLELPPPKKKQKRKNQPYKRASYPGQKLQLDVKHVPLYCIMDGKKYYQYTAVDECTRWTYREMYDEHSTYSAFLFLQNLVAKAPFPIRKIQTDNGTEFTNALLVTKSKHKTLFEQALLDMGIAYHRIRIATPRHNGKVERRHRTDELRFYKHMRMFSLEDGRRQLAEYQRRSNDYIMTCLGMKSPNEVLAAYNGVMW